MLKKTMFFVMLLAGVAAAARENESCRKGYAGDVRYGVGMSAASGGVIEIDNHYLMTAHGYCFGNGLFVYGKAGVQVNARKESGAKTGIFALMMGGVKYSFMDRPVSPYVELSGGFSHDIRENAPGYVVLPSVGVDIRRISVCIGYEYMSNSYDSIRLGISTPVIGIQYHF